MMQGYQEYFKRAWRDCLTSYLLGLTFFPLLCVVGLLCGILYVFGLDWYNALFVMLHRELGLDGTWLSWVQTLLDYLLGASLVVLFVLGGVAVGLFLMLLVGAFLTPYVVRYVQSRHYQTCKIEGDTNALTSCLRLFSVYVRYGLFVLVLLPFYCIPFVGGFVLLLPSYWLFSQTMVEDVGGMILKHDTLRRFKKEQKVRISSVVFLLFGMSLIPIVGFFSYIYALSVLSHVFFDMQVKEKYGNTNAN